MHCGECEVCSHQKHYGSLGVIERYLCDVQVLLVALNSIGEVSQCCVNGAHVAQLASLGELALGLSCQQHTLFMARQCVGIVADSCVHVAQTAESIGRSLESHNNKNTPVSVQSRQRKHTEIHFTTRPGQDY